MIECKFTDCERRPHLPRSLRDDSRSRVDSVAALSDGPTSSEKLLLFVVVRLVKEATCHGSVSVDQSMYFYSTNGLSRETPHIREVRADSGSMAV
jgi:hypothetical protein